MNLFVCVFWIHNGYFVVENWYLMLFYYTFYISKICQASVIDVYMNSEHSVDLRINQRRMTIPENIFTSTIFKTYGLKREIAYNTKLTDFSIFIAIHNTLLKQTYIFCNKFSVLHHLNKLWVSIGKEPNHIEYEYCLKLAFNRSNIYKGWFWFYWFCGRRGWFLNQSYKKVKTFLFFFPLLYSFYRTNKAIFHRISIVWLVKVCQS